MNPIQLTLEQVFKEYIAFKDNIESDKRTIEDLRKEVAQKTLSGEKNQVDATFEVFGEKELKNLDFRQIGIKLHYYCEALKNIVEIPKEITEIVDKINIKQAFAVVNNKLEIADREFYDLTKKQFEDAIEANRIAEKD